MILLQIKKDSLFSLDVHLPAAPVACKWVTKVSVGHDSDELWHWAVDLHCLAENPLCTECFVCCHTKRRTKTVDDKLYKKK